MEGRQKVGGEGRVTTVQASMNRAGCSQFVLKPGGGSVVSSVALSQDLRLSMSRLEKQK